MALAGRTPNNEDIKWMSWIGDYGCIACHNKLRVHSPALVHHIDGKTKPGAHLKTIPLCPRHHKDYGYGISLHDGLRFWETIFGTQEELLKQMQKIRAEELK